VVGIGAQGFSVFAEDGLPDLGSLDLDQALLVHIGRSVSHAGPAQWQRRRRRALLQDVRDAKESLSRHQQTERQEADPDRCRRAGAGPVLHRTAQAGVS
jgi:molecular chaperone DnaK (HSP70)